MLRASSTGRNCAVPFVQPKLPFPAAPVTQAARVPLPPFMLRDRNGRQAHLADSLCALGVEHLGCAWPSTEKAHSNLCGCYR